MLADCGALSDILASGARLLECACGPCIGMGFSPNSGGVSLRTFNRNFEGRSGTADAKVYLVISRNGGCGGTHGRRSPTRAIWADAPAVAMPGALPDRTTARSCRLPIRRMRQQVEVLRGPNIKPFPEMRSAGQTPHRAADC